jgi:hypothetical protein
MHRDPVSEALSFGVFPQLTAIDLDQVPEQRTLGGTHTPVVPKGAFEQRIVAEVVRWHPEPFGPGGG